MSPTRRAVAGYGVAVALLVAGAVLVATAGRYATFGWFAYAPTAPADRLGHLAVWTWSRIGGTLLVIAGLLAAAVTTGGQLGRHAVGAHRRERPRVAAALAVALVVVGAVVLAVAARDPGPTSVTISRAPADLSTLRLATWVWTRGQAAGAGLLLGGLLLGAAAFGSRWSRRLRRPEHSPADPPPAPADPG